MLPMIPWGQLGSPAMPGIIEGRSSPKRSKACLAQYRARANSSCRLATALSMYCCSSGCNSSRTFSSLTSHTLTSGANSSGINWLGARAPDNGLLFPRAAMAVMSPTPRPLG